MKYIITPTEAMNKCIWTELCNLKGINEWAVAEGLMDSDHEIVLTEEEAQRLGLVRKDEGHGKDELDFV